MKLQKGGNSCRNVTDCKKRVKAFIPHYSNDEGQNRTSEKSRFSDYLRTSTFNLDVFDSLDDDDG